MKIVEPEVHLVSRPDINWQGLSDYILSTGARSDRDEVEPWAEWATTRLMSGAPEGEGLVEAAGRTCYRSWEPGLNPNISKVREDRAKYLENILKSGHGSVLEHANYSFAFRNISRVLTHELVRHRAGTAISQESMRYVRLDSIPFWVPAWARKDKELMSAVRHYLDEAEKMQHYLADYFHLDDVSVKFSEKKAKTSFMRRFAPSGHTTDMMWTANVRALRHIIEARTAPGAEEEIRLVFGKVAEIMIEEAPLLFGDFEEKDGAWVPKWSKV